MSTKDENERLRAGQLPVDPEEDAVPMLSGEPWDEPILFSDTDVPDFPLDVLPPWLGVWVAEQARAVQAPADLPALLGLAVLSLTTAKKISVEIKPGWHEPTNLYVAVALAPGEGKSPIFAAATAPLREWERELRARRAPQIADVEECDRMHEERTQNLRKRAAKASDNERRELEDELRALAVERVGRRAPSAPRLVADDATPEAVGRLLSEQHGRLGVFSSEGGPFAILAGRYSDGRANCELFCKAHSGDAYDLDRIGRPSLHLASPLLAIGLTVQPSVIAGLASTPAFRTLGLLARFLYALPRSRVGGRKADPEPVTESARSEYRRVVRAIAGVAEQFDEHGELVARPIPLTDTARRRLIVFKEEIEPRLGPGGDLQGMADWGNKAPGLVARLAGLLHVGDYAEGGLELAIEGKAMDRALAIGRYAIEHARAAFGWMDADPATSLARHIWTWCRRSDTGAVTRHAMHRALQGRVQRVTDLDAAIEVLAERALLRQVRDVGPRRPGRPAGPMFEINPRARQ
jgi:hypothetical protein